MSPAVPRPRRELLPLLDEEWEWKSFERFCLGYVSLQDDVADASLYGKRGEKQRGIDILATLEDGRTRTYQCRRYKKFTAKQAEKTVQEHDFRADEHVVLLACEAPKGVRDFLARQTNWSAADVEDVSVAVRRRLPRQQARELVEDTFGTDVRRAFLGPEGPLAFLSVDRYFEPHLRPGRLLHQRAELVGRDAELAALHEAAARGQTRVVVLAGTGGQGKTRLVRALATELDRDDLRTLIAAEAVELTADLVDDLPDEPLCVIVDDAHVRGDLAPLLAHARRAAAPLTIVLATRPHRVSGLIAHARQAGFEHAEIASLLLPALDEQALRQIATQLLETEDRRARQLAEAADASPLLCVIGAELLSRDEVPNGALRSHEEFREEVLGRFSDELMGQVGDSMSAPVARRLLELVSAVGPVSVDNDGFFAQAAELLGVTSPEVRRGLGELQRAGLLEARGRLRRVTPDVLADRLLADAALDTSGEPTRYIEEIYRRFGESVLERLMANAALLDWQVRRGQARLLDAIWQQLTQRFEASGAFERARLLEQLQPIAVLQPRQALALARYAMSSQTPSERYSPISEFTTGQREVDRAAVGLLEGAARHADSVQEAMSLLWQLGRSDQRPVAQTSGHPLKVLMSIGDYGRPRRDAEALLGFVERIVRAGADRDAVVPAISLLRPLLAREVERVDASAPWQISIASVSVLADATAPLRERVRSLVRDRARNGELEERLLGVQLLTEALRLPSGVFGRPVAEDELEQWKQDQIALLGALEATFAAANNALVRNRVRAGVRWHADHSRWPEVAERSAAILRDEPSIDERLLAEMVEGWDHADGVEEMLTKRRSLADLLVTELPDGREIAERLSSLLTAASAAGMRSSGSIFIARTGSPPSRDLRRRGRLDPRARCDAARREPGAAARGTADDRPRGCRRAGATPARDGPGAASGSCVVCDRLRPSGGPCRRRGGPAPPRIGRRR